MNQDLETVRGTCAAHAAPAAYARGEIPAVKVASFSQHTDTELYQRTLR